MTPVLEQLQNTVLYRNGTTKNMIESTVICVKLKKETHPD
jgi:hypothetical protein